MADRAVPDRSTPVLWKDTIKGGELLTAAWQGLDASDEHIYEGVDVPMLLTQLRIIINNSLASIDRLRNERRAL